MPAKPRLCPCQSGLTLKECCGPLLEHRQKAETATALMRSRYSAFALGDATYLVDTHLPQQRSANEEQEIKASFGQRTWLALTILSPGGTNPSASNNEVEFIAFFTDDQNRLQQLHERSSFVQVNETWFYADGQLLPPVKLPRNGPCICGSDKKFKKCCGR